MTKLIQLTGRRFGRLVVVSRSTNKPRNHARWNCDCDCGGTTTASSGNLLHANTSSCGCLQKEKCTKQGSAFRILLNSYKQAAKKRNIAWLLTDEQFKVLTTSDCYYTGRKPTQKTKSWAGEIYVYNGVDRLDASGPYSLENCVPCCAEANMAKQCLTVDEFYKLCEEVLQNKGKHGERAGT